MLGIHGPRGQVLLAAARIIAVAVVALAVLLTIRAVNAGDAPVWNSQRPLSYGTIDPMPPGAPEGVTAVSNSSSVTVRWLPPPDEGSFEVTHYAVTSQPTTQGCLAERAIECVITDVGAGTYTFRVQALNGAGWGPWSTWSAPLTLAPPVPTSLSVTGQRQGSRLFVRVTSSGLAEGTVITLYARRLGTSVFAAQSPTATIGAAGAASWTVLWRDRRPVQVYASAGSTLRSSTIRVR